MSKGLEVGKTPQELRRERERRITDAINLEIPDRVPVGCELGFFVARYAGIPCSAAYYDWDAWMAAYRKALDEFQPDMAFVQPVESGKAMEYLDPTILRWPGYGVDPNHGMQSIEIEGLKDDEYDFFLTNPADYLIRRHLPRVFRGLKVLSMLPELSDTTGWLEPYAGERIAMWVTDPEVGAAFEKLWEAGREIRKCKARSAEFDQLMMDYGLPQMYQGDIMPPFDVVSHSLRGMKGTMLDMFRQPAKLLEACDFLLEKALERPLPEPNESGHIRMFMTNTRGSDNFMSTQQFETFYWPTFKKLVMSLIERGATPCVFFEGNFDSRLEYLLDFPKGKMLVRLDRTDIFKAKEILGGHLCIEGNVPSTLLQMGSVQEVKDHCKKLIDVVGKDGGFILGPRSSTDEVKPENLKAMIEFTKEYGRY
jgi:hypothetical protein